MEARYITLSKGNLKVTFSSLGASIVSIYFDDELMTMTPTNLDDLKRKDIYYGKTIGPIANRIKEGLVKVGDKEYRFPLNEEGVCNHSGVFGLSNVLFVSSVSNDRVVFTHQQKINKVNISYVVAYTLNENNEIRLDYLVRVSDDFVLNITNHTFFTLGESSLDNLSLKISADEFIESDRKTLLPLRVKTVETCLDFNKEKQVTKDIDNPYLMDHRTKGYDHCFLLKDKGIILNSSKYSLRITTDYPCVHIYSDNYEDGVITKNNPSKSRRGIAIEPENNLLDNNILKKDEIYQRYIVYSFLKR